MTISRATMLADKSRNNLDTSSQEFADIISKLMIEKSELAINKDRLKKMKATQDKLIDFLVDSAKAGYCRHSECGFNHSQKYEEMLVEFNTQNLETLLIPCDLYQEHR